jgi:hypothetical protein
MKLGDRVGCKFIVRMGFAVHGGWSTVVKGGGREDNCGES